jgi:hypothetical protein
MDLQTLNAWLVMGQFSNDSMEVPNINTTGFNGTDTSSPSFNSTRYVVSGHHEDTFC